MVPTYLRAKPDFGFRLRGRNNPDEHRLAAGAGHEVPVADRELDAAHRLPADELRPADGGDALALHLAKQEPAVLALVDHLEGVSALLQGRHDLAVDREGELPAARDGARDRAARQVEVRADDVARADGRVLARGEAVLARRIRRRADDG